MDIIEIIYSRRNIKKFKADPLNKAQIMKWLEAAAMAPNHRMTEPWEVYIVGEETRARLGHKTNFGNAPIVMAILSKHGKTDIETEENALATACFIQNFNLAAWAEGVGTFWSSIACNQEKREILGIPEGYDVIGTLAAGYPEEMNPPKERTPMHEKTRYLP